MGVKIMDQDHTLLHIAQELGCDSGKSENA